MNNKLIGGTILALIIGGVIGFFGGMTYQKNQKSSLAENMMFQGRASGEMGQRQMGGNTGPRGMSQAGNGVMGEIINSDSQSITVKLDDGSSKIVLITDKTPINKSSEGTLEDLKIGEKVAAFGTTNSDGSVTAVSIQLNPQIRMFRNISPTPEK